MSANPFEQGGLNSSGDDTASNYRIRTNGYVMVEAGTQYTLSSNIANVDIVAYDSSKGYLGIINSNFWDATPYTFTTPTGCQYLRIALAKNRASSGSSAIEIVPSDFQWLQLELGPTATTFKPYSNICPISGHQGVTVYRTGRNLYSRDNGEYNVPVYTTDGTSAPYQDVNAVWIPVKPSTQYTIVLQPNTVTYFVRWIECDENKGYVWRDSSTMSSAGVRNRTYTTKATTRYLQIAINQYQTSQIALNDWEVCIQEGTDTTYHAYSGTTFPITWQDEAGTVYGGTLRINEDGSGVLTVTHGIVDLGNKSWTYYTSGTNPIFYTNIDGVKHYSLNDVPDAISSMYKVRQVQARSTFATNALNGEFSFFTDTDSLAIRNSAYTSASDFKTAMSGQTVVYELATPLVYTLTAEQVGQIATLQGTNVIWVDDSDEISVTYQFGGEDRSRNLEYNYLNLRLFNETFIEKH